MAAAFVAVLTHFFCSKRVDPVTPIATFSRGQKRQADDEEPPKSYKKVKLNHPGESDTLDAALALAQRDVLPTTSAQRRPITLGRTTSPLSPYPVPFERKSLPRSKHCRKPLPLHRQALLRWHDIGLRKRLLLRPPQIVSCKSAPLPPLVSPPRGRQLSRSPMLHSRSPSPRIPWPLVPLRSDLDVEMFCEEEDFEDDEFDDGEEDEDIDSDSDDESDRSKSYINLSPVKVNISDLPIPPLPDLTRVNDAITNSEDVDEDDSSDSDEEEPDWDIIIPSESVVTLNLGITPKGPIVDGAIAKSQFIPSSLYGVGVRERFDEFV